VEETVVSPILAAAVHPAEAVPAAVGKSAREILSGYFICFDLSIFQWKTPLHNLEQYNRETRSKGRTEKSRLICPSLPDLQYLSCSRRQDFINIKHPYNMERYAVAIPKPYTILEVRLKQHHAQNRSQTEQGDVQSRTCRIVNGSAIM
jgi:hypothetical protein